MDEAIGGALAFTCGFVIAAVLFWGHDATGLYRQGQIDALRGNIKYELRENERGELVWLEKDSEQAQGAPAQEVRHE